MVFTHFLNGNRSIVTARNGADKTVRFSYFQIASASTTNIVIDVEFITINVQASNHSNAIIWSHT